MDSNQTFGKLERVPLRDIWAHEAHDFTPWLADKDNLKMLSEAVNIPFVFERLENPVGTLRNDILARRVPGGHPVVIENQLDRSDHTHLGQIVTYAALMSEVTIIWVAGAFSSEHKKALQWIQATHTRALIIAVEIAVYRIGQSKLAPTFTPIVINSEPATCEKAVTRQNAIQYPTVYGVSQETVKQVIDMHLSGVAWTAVATKLGKNYSRVIIPIRKEWVRRA